MKSLMACLGIALLGCSSFGLINYYDADYVLSQTKETAVGSPMFFFERGLISKGMMSDKVQDSFKEELIYSGIDGTTIQITFREFRQDMIRQGFTQYLKYDLTNSDTIQFKDFKIKVLQANNSSIRFTVVEGPDTSGMTRLQEAK